MISEKRFEVILDEVNRKGIVTVKELTKLLGTSDATTRRDLQALDDMGKLVKFHGGAKKTDNDYILFEEDFTTKKELNTQQKADIASYASKLIEKNDFIYIDAGTSTLDLVKAMKNLDLAGEVEIVTNALKHAALLSRSGYRVHVLEGDIKASTEAIVGNTAVLSLQKYNFTKSFMGTNGIHPNAGFTTYDIRESTLKELAMKHSKQAFVLADNSKFDKIAPLSFAGLNEAEIITTVLKNRSYEDMTTIREVSK